MIPVELNAKMPAEVLLVKNEFCTVKLASSAKMPKSERV